MMRDEYFNKGVATVWLSSLLFVAGCAMSPARVATATPLASPVRLFAIPNSVVAKAGRPILVRIGLENTTDHFVGVRAAFNLYPAQQDNYNYSLRTLITRASGGPPVRYLGPIRKSGPYKERGFNLNPHFFVGFDANLAAAFDLPPGHYHARFWYDTSQAGQGETLEPRAWHGRTNAADVDVTVVP